MDKKEIIIKSYKYREENATLLLTVIFGLAGLIFVIFSPFPKVVSISLGGVAVVFFICFLTLRVKCKTYDIYNENGMQRVNKDTLVFKIEWKDVESSSYWGVIGIVLLQPLVLDLHLFKPLEKDNYRNRDHSKLVSCPMNKKNYKRVLAFIPKEIIDKPIKH